MTILSQRTLNARKEHVCDICSEKIMPGDKYVKYAAIGEDGFFAVKIHLPCWEVGQYLDDDPWDRLPFADVVDTAVEQYRYVTGIETDWKTAFQYFYERAVKK